MGSLKPVSRRKFMATSVGVATGIAALSAARIPHVAAQSGQGTGDPEGVIAAVDQIAPAGVIQTRVKDAAADQLAAVPLAVAQSKHAALSGAAFAPTQSLTPDDFSELSNTANSIVQTMAEDGLRFTNYTLDTQIEGVWAEQATATVVWTEKVVWNLAGDPDPSAPQTAGETRTHLTSLRKNGDLWLIEADDADFGLPAMELPLGTPAIPDTETPAETARSSQSSGNTQGEETAAPTAELTATYNRQAAARYATVQGPKQGENGYHDYGNNCANFVSQCLKAGGWPQKPGYYKSTTGWWYHGIWPIYSAYPWHNAHYWWWFTRNNDRGTILRSIWDLWVGDVLQYNFDKNRHINHSAIVHYRSSRGIIYMAQHTSNYAWKPLSQIYGELKNSCWYWPWRMKTRL